MLRVLGLLFLIILLRDGMPPGSELEASAPPLVQDSDHDGLSDQFEAYLSTASTDPALAANPLNADSDGDGQPDGFEYVLSERKEVFSPGKLHSLVPKVAMGSHQAGNQLILSLYVIPADLQAVDKFHFLVSVPSGNGSPYVFDLTELLALNITGVGVTSYGPYSLAVFQTSIPVEVMDLFSSFAIAALGEVAGIRTGDSGTYTVHNGSVYRWEYTPVAQPPTAGQSSSDYADGEAQPQQGDAGPGYQEVQVCLSVDAREPTGVPGVLQSVVMSINCNGGDWTCHASICATGGPASQPKVVLDHLELLK
ncbi:MAG: hypothetical protein HY812_13935 [Planctomycetes bacterium]|nr:hypothetical protein [Planctomycetota bacterium]